MTPSAVAIAPDPTSTDRKVQVRDDGTVQVATKEVSVEEVIEAIAMFNGEMKVAAEALAMTQDQIFNILSSQPQALAANIRVRAIVNSYGMLKKLTETVTAKAAGMDPFDAVKGVTTLMTNIEALTRPPASAQGGNTVNIGGVILQQLQPKDRDIVQRLTSMSDADFTELDALDFTETSVSIDEEAA